MRIKELKSALIDKIDQSDNVELMQYLLSLLDETPDRSSDYPEAIQKAIETALKQSDNNQIKPHHEVMKNWK